jgi:glycerol-3-phosphate cytidylyltransferase
MKKTKWNDNYLTAYIGGTFDILHAGHINLIKKVKEMNIRPIIVVNGDKFVSENKKNCVYSAKERATALVEFFPDDTIEIIEHMKDQRANIANKKPNFIVVGTDWMRPEILPQLGLDDDFLRTYNIAMLFIPRFNSISSTSIKNTLRSHM